MGFGLFYEIGEHLLAGVVLLALQFVHDIWPELFVFDEFYLALKYELSLHHYVHVVRHLSLFQKDIIGS